MHWYRLLWACLPFAVLAALFTTVATAPAAQRPLRIATWNLEWLVDGDTALAAGTACRAGLPSALPCDVVRELPRDSADLARLAAYASRLDADVIAFQEVQDAAIAHRVFRGYRICLHPGAGLQQVGFAVRPRLAHDCGQPLAALAVHGRGRAGLQLRIEVPKLGPIILLVVHLKSGCAHDPLHSPTPACRLLAAQAEALGRWIAAHADRHTRFIVLGDFNRGGPPAAADPFWRVLDPGSFLASSNALPFTNCVWGAPYRDFIDHILVSQTLAGTLASPPFDRFTYRAQDAVRYHLSDHCPVRVSLNVSMAL